MSSQNELIVRLPNWLGDVVMALPAIDYLHRNGIKLELVGRPWITALLSPLPYQCHTLPPSKLAAAKLLRELSPEHMLLLTNSLSSAVIGKLAGKKSLGYAVDHRSLLLQYPVQKFTGAHEVAYFWQLAKQAANFWFAVDDEILLPEKIHLPVNEAVKKTVATQVAGLLGSEDYWVLCPFAIGRGDKRHSKVWPHWQVLLSELSVRDIPVVICPGPREEHLAAEFEGYATVLNQLDLSEYAAVLAGAKQVVANDSGPMHLAAAVGAPTLGLFGASDPRRVRPWGASYLGKLGQWPTTAAVLQQLQLSD